MWKMQQIHQLSVKDTMQLGIPYLKCICTKQKKSHTVQIFKIKIHRKELNKIPSIIEEVNN